MEANHQAPYCPLVEEMLQACPLGQPWCSRYHQIHLVGVVADCKVVHVVVTNQTLVRSSKAEYHYHYSIVGFPVSAVLAAVAVAVKIVAVEAVVVFSKGNQN